MAGEKYGHVKISRKAFEDDDFWLERREFSKWEAWVDMIQMAAWKPYTRLVGSTSIELGRGEFLASIRYLAKRWNWGEKKVRIFLTRTIADRVSVRSESEKGHIYLLVNYDAYQSEGHTKGTGGAQQGHKEKTIKQLSNKEDMSESDVLFELAWKAYPKRPNNPKKKAKDCWAKLVEGGVEPGDLLAAVDRYAKYCKVEKKDPQFVMMAMTFFGPSERWKDDYTVVEGGGSDDFSEIKMLINTGGSSLFNAFSREQAFRTVADTYPALFSKHEATLRRLNYGELKGPIEQRNKIEYNEALRTQLKAISNAA